MHSMRRVQVAVVLHHAPPFAPDLAFVVLFASQLFFSHNNGAPVERGRVNIDIMQQIASSVVRVETRTFRFCALGLYSPP